MGKLDQSSIHLECRYITSKFIQIHVVWNTKPVDTHTHTHISYNREI